MASICGEEVFMDISEISEKAKYNYAENHLTKKEKTNYLIGLAGQNIVYSLVGGSFFTYFLTDIAIFPSLVVAILLILGKVWDGINDPIIGSIVDKHIFKSGEKLRPLLKLTPIPVGIFTVLMFLVFPGGDKLLWLRISYFVIMYLCWDIVYTLQDVSIWGITAMMTPIPLERENIIKWARTVGTCVFGVASGLIPMALETFVKVTKSSWQLGIFVFAIIFGLSGALMSRRAYKAKERVPVVEKQESLKKSFSLLKKNRILMLISTSNILCALGFGGNLVTYFFKYMVPQNFIGLSIIGALGLTTIFNAIINVPSLITMVFADKIKKLCNNSYLNVLIMIQIINIIFRIIAFFIGFQGKNLWISITMLALAAFPSGATSIAQTTLFNDSIDYVEWQSGMRTEGVTFSMQTFFTKVSSGLSQGLSMIVLSLLGYVAIDKAETFIGTQTAAFETWIWPLFILTPAMGSILYIIPLLFVNYTKKQKAIVESDLKNRRLGLRESGLSPYYKEALAEKFQAENE